MPKTTTKPDRLKQAHDKLQAAVESIVTGEDWQRMLKVASKFPSLQPEQAFWALIDRFDIQAMMARPTRAELMSREPSEPSSAIRDRVEAAREVQNERYRPSLIFVGA